MVIDILRRGLTVLIFKFGKRLWANDTFRGDEVSKDFTNHINVYVPFFSYCLHVDLVTKWKVRNISLTLNNYYNKSYD